jgi:hypothetical protein
LITRPLRTVLGNPRKAWGQAARYAALARRVNDPKLKKMFLDLEATWTRRAMLIDETPSRPSGKSATPSAGR